MARKVFFSFHFDRDNWRVAKVRNSNVVLGYDKNKYFSDKADWEKIKRQGPRAIQSWIDNQLIGTSVTVVLIGQETSKRPWVKYEIQQSIARGNGLLGVRIHRIRDRFGNEDNQGANPLPSGYPVYNWNQAEGAKNLGRWIEAAAKKAGK